MKSTTRAIADKASAKVAGCTLEELVMKQQQHSYIPTIIGTATDADRKLLAQAYDFRATELGLECCRSDYSPTARAELIEKASAGAA